MADDSIEIIEPLDFHPLNTPRGCLYYNPAILTDCQQLKLNDLKTKVIKSDEKYLHNHPEIRGFIVMITRYIFKKRPYHNLPGIIKEFFDRPHVEINAELDEYLSGRPPIEEYAEEEETHFSEDLTKYLKSMRPGIEEEEEREKEKGEEKGEKPSKRRSTRTSIPLVEVDTETFIRQLLIDRIRKFPSKTRLTKDRITKSSENALQERLERVTVVESMTMSRKTTTTEGDKDRRKSYVQFMPQGTAPDVTVFHSTASWHSKDTKKEDKKSAEPLIDPSITGHGVHDMHKDLLNPVHSIPKIERRSIIAFERRKSRSESADKKKSV